MTSMTSERKANDEATRAKAPMALAAFLVQRVGHGGPAAS
jgi:hypothetical protein